MNYCPHCEAKIKGDGSHCPLCQSSLIQRESKESNKQSNSSFPDIPLSSLRILYTIMNCLIGHYSLAIEKNTYHTQVVLAQARPSNDLKKIKFYLYRFI